jgi:hypothetical protein
MCYFVFHRVPSDIKGFGSVPGARQPSCMDQSVQLVSSHRSSPLLSADSEQRDTRAIATERRSIQFFFTHAVTAVYHVLSFQTDPICAKLVTI